MAFLRFLVILLILINTLMLAAWEGWLGQGGGRGEPERLTNQLQPARIRLLDKEAPMPVATPAPPAPTPAAEPPAVEPPAVDAADAAPETAETAAPPPVPDAVAEPAVTAEPPDAPAPPACVAFAELDDEAAALVMGDALAQAGFEAKDITSVAVTSWWVHLPSQGSREAADRKVAELRTHGVSDLFAIGERGARPFAISLGLFKSAESAAEQRRRLEAKGVTGVQIEERGQTSHRVEVRGPAEALTGWASDWSSRVPKASRLDCRP
ncbi:SPOR domain-containing protein [Nitrogeniibacter mangrovi]|uniref:SPOR domain-containing protein n=1 Tax=Nitrogeniibacter mangrovi TaxID=2016596 RepID=A0A6C1B590_9RHOO|nr:SPOR domain-containing protein [Nitrogeniibacter mangrovi]QID18862.1 SPOR domain-containing protein [Nitrogeniibacter mangrovi]